MFELFVSSLIRFLMSMLKFHFLIRFLMSIYKKGSHLDFLFLLRFFLVGRLYIDIDRKIYYTLMDKTLEMMKNGEK